MPIRNIMAALALTLLATAPAAMALNTRSVSRTSQTNRNVDRFARLDRDGNGVITRDEWRGNDNSFRKHDRNGDGVISAADRQGKAKGKFKEHRQNRDDD